MYSLQTKQQKNWHLDNPWLCFCRFNYTGMHACGANIFKSRNFRKLPELPVLVMYVWVLVFVLSDLKRQLMIIHTGSQTWIVTLALGF